MKSGISGKKNKGNGIVLIGALGLSILAIGGFGAYLAAPSLLSSSAPVERPKVAEPAIVDGPKLTRFVTHDPKDYNHVIVSNLNVETGEWSYGGEATREDMDFLGVIPPKKHALSERLNSIQETLNEK